MIMGIQCQIKLSVPSVLCSFLSEYRNLLAASTKVCWLELTITREQNHVLMMAMIVMMMMETTTMMTVKAQIMMTVMASL